MTGPTRVAVQASMIRLRQDALASNMPDLAIVYGWSAIRISGEIVLAASGALRAEQDARSGRLK